MTKCLFFDCETVPNYDLANAWMERRARPDFTKTFVVPPSGDVVVFEESDSDAFSKQAEQDWIDAQMKAMALQPEACTLVGLNVCLGDGEPKSGWVGEKSPAGDVYSESDLLVMFWSWAASAPRLIGFNCINFDLNVIRVRSAVLGVAPTRNFFDLKPWEDVVIDLMQKRFKGTSRDSYLSLKALRRLLGFQVPEKYQEVLDNTGADVESLYLRFLASDDAEALRLLKLYGELDVWSTRELAKLFSGYFFQRIE